MMTTRIPDNPETKFDRSSWLTLAFVVFVLVYNLAMLAYRFTLPTDGWVVNEATELGFNYIENLMSAPSGLQPGDNVIAVDGYPANLINFPPALQQAWQVGATLDYTLIRGGQEVQMPVTLTHWQFGKWLRDTLSDPYELMGLFSDYFLLILAFFVFLRRPGNPTTGAFLLLIALLVDLTHFPIGWPEFIDPLANIFVVRWQAITLPILLPFVLIRFALVFPHPKPVVQRLPWLVFVPPAIGFIISVLSPYSYLGWFWLLISLVLTVAILIHNAITMSDAVSRAQILWGLGGIIFGFGLLTLLLVANTFEWIKFNENFTDLVSAIAVMGMGICLVIAITRYRLFDIEVIIRRTLVYAALTATLALVYFGSVILLQGLFEAVSARSAGSLRSPVATVISTLVIAALFTPLRRRIQNDIDRRFFRRKYDSEKVVAAFSASLRDEVDLDDLQDQIMAVVEATLQPERLSLWLKETSK